MCWAGCRWLGRRLPLQLRYLFSMAVIGLAFFLLAYLVTANKERALALAPQYQQSLLAAIQRMAVFFGFETEPTWATLRQELMAQINLQRLFGSLLASLGSILVTFVVVFLYATFLLVERTRLRDQAGQPVGRPASAWRASARSSRPSTGASARTWR